MKKSILIWLAALVGFILGVWMIYQPLRDITVIKWPQLRAREYPEGELQELVIFGIKPKEILTSINQGKTDIFTPLDIDPNEYTPPKWSSGTFAWSDEEYYVIANALHEYYWGESLETWRLVHASYNIERCKNVFGGIDFAGLLFYQIKDNMYVIHGFWISPLHETVIVGDNSFPYTGKWENFNINDAAVRNVDLALQIAEKNGGRKARMRVQNDCQIHVLFAPYATHTFFGASNWGWGVLYRDSDLNIIFEKRINPYEGI